MTRRIKWTLLVVLVSFATFPMSARILEAQGKVAGGMVGRVLPLAGLFGLGVGLFYFLADKRINP